MHYKWKNKQCIKINYLKKYIIILYRAIMRKNGNKSFYHYIMKIKDDNGDEQYEYFLTLQQLGERLGVSRYTLNTALNNPDYKMRKNPNVKLQRCYIPVMQELKLETKDLDFIREELYS
jgi:DNA-binding XRE family transcriptional regulator